MIEGIGTVAHTAQTHTQEVQGHVEGVVETTPEVTQGKVNEVEKFENLSEDTTPDKGDTPQQSAQFDDGSGHIVNLLG